ncbi:MAG: hypothetical protein NC453_13920 [Muribaculum sp.]|nr:hypothetical protein [Muribaculum sp.]
MAKPITDIQKDYIDRLVCERLSANLNNLRDVGGFDNYYNPQLVSTIQNEANEQDENGEIAFFVVRDSMHPNDILCYFSLKTGILFDKIGELEILEAKKKLHYLVKRKKSLKPSIELNRIGEDLDKEISSLRNFLKKSFEINQEDDEHKRVAKTYSAIELTHFCVNDKARKIWVSNLMGGRNRIGLTIFWSKIVPIILAASKYVGIKYVYLFAADESIDERLINHYIAFMSFERNKGLYTALPIYDFGCTLLIQDISTLKSNQFNFFNEFNVEEEV